MSREEGRFLLVTLDYATGTHQIHNWPTISRNDCYALCHGMGPVEERKHRLILQAHTDNPKEAP